ncbi:MAG: gamma-glutamylcyclotransferase [Roseivivax sp.]|nr:gamma-glutamylcyclotransferase [Roseivivax sp.]
MRPAFFFGYGSLVNRHTHRYDAAHAASVRGWRRAWRYTPDRQVAYLTAVRDADCRIDGLVAHVPGGNWAALDLREHAYERLNVTADVTHPGDPLAEVAIYAIAPERLHLPDADHPVLLSYVDVVVQGYLHVYGAAGAERFFDTTTGWNAPIRDDRANPQYPRAQRLSDAERAVVDAALARLDCTVLA